jgi:hypothetical protein
MAPLVLGALGVALLSRIARRDLDAGGSVAQKNLLLDQVGQGEGDGLGSEPSALK